MSDVLLVITNLPDAVAAERMARQLIEQNVAACVNQLAPCISTYRWQDKIETASEVPLLIKTTASAYARLEAAIRAVESADEGLGKIDRDGAYSVPCRLRAHLRRRPALRRI